jgi:hypothetical protein
MKHTTYAQYIFCVKLVFELDERDLYVVLAHNLTTVGLICINFYTGGPCLPVPPVSCYSYDGIKVGIHELKI